MNNVNKKYRSLFSLLDILLLDIGYHHIYSNSVHCGFCKPESIYSYTNYRRILVQKILFLPTLFCLSFCSSLLWLILLIRYVFSSSLCHSVKGTLWILPYNLQIWIFLSLMTAIAFNTTEKMQHSQPHITVSLTKKQSVTFYFRNKLYSHQVHLKVSTNSVICIS